MYDYGARNYDPALGRWMNIDPKAEKYFNLSPYVYVANSPIIFMQREKNINLNWDVGNAFIRYVGGNQRYRNK